MSSSSDIESAQQQLLYNMGALFEECREEAGLTQYQVADLVGTTQARVSYLEAGKGDVKLLTLQRFARAFGYNIDIHLFPIEDESKGEENGDGAGGDRAQVRSPQGDDRGGERDPSDPHGASEEVQGAGEVSGRDAAGEPGEEFGIYVVGRGVDVVTQV